MLCIFGMYQVLEVLPLHYFSNVSKFEVVNVKRFIRARAGVSVVVFPK